jgi:cytochrome o ubiquinol oxidase subunit 1
MPLYILGLMGVTRRMRVFDDPSLQVWFGIAALGAVIIAAGIAAMLIQFGVSIWRRKELAEPSGDPWGGRTLEWATSSPPPDYNFAFTPVIHDLDAWYDMKNRNAQRPVGGFRDIHMPRNTGTGIILSGIALVIGFALVWHIFWLAAAGLVALVGGAIAHSFNYKRDFHIPAATVRETEDLRTRQLAAGTTA